MFPVSGDVGKSSIIGVSDWSLLLAYKLEFEVSIRCRFSCGLLMSILATYNWVVAILISDIRSRDTIMALAFLKSCTPKIRV